MEKICQSTDGIQQESVLVTGLLTPPRCEQASTCSIDILRNIPADSASSKTSGSHG